MELNWVDDNFVLNIDKIDIMYIDCEIVCCLLDWICVGFGSFIFVKYVFIFLRMYFW